MELVYMDGRKEPYTTSEIIAECAEVQHHTITRLLRNHKERFEAFGFYGFEIHKLDGKGRPKKSLSLKRTTGYFADHLSGQHTAGCQIQNKPSPSIL